eukprot:2459851-Rhodomonas_salina.1
MVLAGSLEDVTALDMSRSFTSKAKRRTGRRSGTPATESLLSLTLVGNKIGILESGALQFPNLKYLDVSDCAITGLEVGALDGLPNLEQIVMQQNKFFGSDGILRPETFAGLLNLEVLDLSNLKIKGIESGALASLSKLKKLDLSNNFLCA